MRPPCSQAKPLLIDQAGGIVFQRRDVGRINRRLALAARRNAEDFIGDDAGKWATHFLHPEIASYSLYGKMIDLCSTC